MFSKKTQRNRKHWKLGNMGNQLWCWLFSLTVVPTRLPAPRIKNPRLFPLQATGLSPSLTVKHRGVGFPILKLYIKSILKGPRVRHYRAQGYSNTLERKSTSWLGSHFHHPKTTEPPGGKCELMRLIMAIAGHETSDVTFSCQSLELNKPKGLRFPAFQDLKDFLPAKAQTWLSGVCFSRKH